MEQLLWALWFAGSSASLPTPVAHFATLAECERVGRTAAAITSVNSYRCIQANYWHPTPPTPKGPIK